jgi:hypothetical protein
MNWIRDYQELIALFVTALGGGLLFVWRLLLSKQDAFEGEFNQRLHDHENRIRVMEHNYASKQDFARLREDLEGRIRELNDCVHEATEKFCAHNSETRSQLQEAIRGSEQHITGRIDAIVAAMSVQRHG